MLPGMLMSPLSLALTAVGFLAGMGIWQIVASYAKVWARMELDPSPVWALLRTQITIVVGVTMLLIVLSALLGETVGAPFSWLATLGGIVFWAYLGAIVLTGLRSMFMRQ